MNLLYALDPGPVQSALVIATHEGAHLVVRDHCHTLNGAIHEMLLHAPITATLVIERITSFGMPVGEEILETVFQTGCFFTAWPGLHRYRLSRRAIKLHLCGSSQAKDTNVRAAVFDRYGGSREAAVGTVKHQGPLYGLHGHEIAALAVALTWVETHTPQHVGASV